MNISAPSGSDVIDTVPPALVDAVLVSFSGVGAGTGITRARAPRSLQKNQIFRGILGWACSGQSGEDGRNSDLVKIVPTHSACQSCREGGRGRLGTVAWDHLSIRQSRVYISAGRIVEAGSDVRNL